MTFNVLICDDDADQVRDWHDRIRAIIPEGGPYSLGDVRTTSEINEGVQSLLLRQRCLREEKDKPVVQCLFDEVDILIVDYDLVHIDEEKTRHTGEGIARLARAFSTCGLIVILNQHPEVEFDLSLRGNLESHADLNLHGDLVASAGLWMPPPWKKEFRPWHWPVLSSAAAALRRRTDFISKNIDRTILGTLGFTEREVSRLSDSAFGFVAPGANNSEALNAITFSQFISGNSSAVDPKDGRALHIGKDVSACARIAASRLAKWMERSVLGPQDILVDVPHLMQRMPFLTKGERTELGVWNEAVNLGRGALTDEVPESAWFKNEDWLTRPALWWTRIEDDGSLREKRLGYDYSSSPNYVFQEDASCFARFEDAKQFRAGFHNHFDRRYAAEFNAIRYAPRRRFAL